MITNSIKRFFEIENRKKRDERIEKCGTIPVKKSDGYRAGFYMNACGDIGCPKCIINYKAWNFLNRLRKRYPAGFNYEILEIYDIDFLEEPYIEYIDEDESEISFTEKFIDMVYSNFEKYKRMESRSDKYSIFTTFYEVVKITPYDPEDIDGCSKRSVLWNSFNEKDYFFTIARNYRYLKALRRIHYYIQEEYKGVPRIKHRNIKEDITIRSLPAVKEEINYSIWYRFLKMQEEKISLEEADILPRIEYKDISIPDGTFNVAVLGEEPEDISLEELVKRVTNEGMLYRIIWGEYFGFGKNSEKLLKSLQDRYKLI